MHNPFLGRGLRPQWVEASELDDEVVFLEGGFPGIDRLCQMGVILSSAMHGTQSSSRQHGRWRSQQGYCCSKPKRRRLRSRNQPGGFPFLPQWSFPLPAVRPCDPFQRSLKQPSQSSNS